VRLRFFSEIGESEFRSNFDRPCLSPILAFLHFFNSKLGGSQNKYFQMAFLPQNRISINFVAALRMGWMTNTDKDA
jgi:hypothetical protein